MACSSAAQYVLLGFEFFGLNPIVASGVPHAVIKDDIYKGYYIPAGTVVVGNTWYMRPYCLSLVIENRQGDIERRVNLRTEHG